MTRRLYLFDPPDRFVAGTVGDPGERTFFLQARAGDRLVSVVLEKVQVAVLAERLGRLLDDLERAGLPGAGTATEADLGMLDEPLIGAFRAGTLTLGWDGERERILVEARADSGFEEDEDDEDEEPAELTAADIEAAGGRLPDPTFAAAAAAMSGQLADLEFEDPDDDPDGPDLLRVTLSAEAARSFVESAMRLVAAGRPPCPLCGQPLDRRGHLCPRRNGHFLN